MGLSSKSAKTEGGTGGKRGHSNMTHWDFTEAIKKRNNKARRLRWKKELQKDNFE